MSTASSYSESIGDGDRVAWATLHPNQHPGPECFWWLFAETYGSPNVQWCEETLCHIVSQPANTFSNLSYIAFSFLMWWRLAQLRSYSKKHSDKNWAPFGKHRSPRVPGFIPLNVMRVYPWCNFFCGGVSAVYHAANIYPAQLMDFMGMYAVTGWLIWVNWQTSKKSTMIRWIAGNAADSRSNCNYGTSHGRSATPSTGFHGQLVSFLSVFIVTCSILCHWMHLHGIKFQSTVAVMVLVIILQEFLCCFPLETELLGSSKSHSRRFLWLGLATLLIAAAFSYSDVTRKFCNPKDHLVQGHAMWHIISSAALYFLFENKLIRTAILSEGAVRVYSV